MVTILELTPKLCQDKFSGPGQFSARKVQCTMTISSLLTPTRLLSPASARRVLGRLLGLAALWLQRTRERRQLRALDDHALADLGLDRDQIMHEIDKHFWQR
jgi:uncharacterized protein YjiS (DUF1127 family)